MIVEPVRTGPRSRPRRAAARLAVILPGLLLALVATAGILGPSSPNVSLAPPSSGAAASTPRLASPSTPLPGPGELVQDPAVPFPATIDGLPVHPIPDVLAARAAGIDGGIVAVEGYLGVLEAPTDCTGGQLGSLGPLCVRQALLGQQRWTLVDNESAAGIGPHLHATVPMGVRLPPAISRTTRAAGGTPLAAVLVGRFEPLPLSGCAAADVRCDEGFVVEGVAWSEGESFAPEAVVDARVQATPVEWLMQHERVAVQALGRATTLLVAALLQPDALASVDVSAADAIGSRRTAGGLLWYVRGLSSGVGVVPGRAGPKIVWVVFDDTAGTVIARGVVPGS